MNLKNSLLAALLCLLPGIALAQTLEGKVTKVIDGDSMFMKIGKSTLEVRLYGINCPERGHPYGNQATEYTREQCEGKTVQFLMTDIDTTHSAALDTDKRIIGVVTLPNGKNLSHLLVEKGLARWYKKYANNDKKLESLEKKARKKKAGLWKSM